MCGIAGLWTSVERDAGWIRDHAATMAAALEHRGPNDAGAWACERTGVGLGFQRLSILDLSQAGHQPMQSPHGRYWLVFNGEIYNHADLRRCLERDGQRFHSTSDTEVVAASFERWGIPEAARRFVGMFAIAVWDTADCCLTLLRDRLGVKPLYYGTAGRDLVFASELKAVRRHPDFAASLNDEALSHYLRLGYIPHPYSIYRGISQLQPGCMLSWKTPADNGRLTPYWSARAAASTDAQINAEEAMEHVEEALRSAVACRLRSDVPLGAFLSGGVDSSLVVAMMQEISGTPVKTFTISFGDKFYDEAPYARAVAEHLRTDHEELSVTPSTAQAVIPRLAEIYDEPFADASQIPTLLVSELAKRHVTVALSGDGGDEVFGGYAHYRLGDVSRRLQRIPSLLRPPAVVAAKVAARTLDHIRVRPFGVTPSRLRAGAGVLQWGSAEGYYYSRSQWRDLSKLAPRLRGRASTLPELRGGFPDSLESAAERMMYLDSTTYLPDCILVKVDRASMAHSLEVRGPLLDHRLYELARRLPMPAKIRDGSGKWVLRELLRKRIPGHLVDRPKQGFSVPIGDWLRGPLRSWAEDLLSPVQLKDHFDVATVRRGWEACQRGQTNADAGLWSVLMFQAWRLRWL
jgi:asparagine synthase (glutamine-hydrolysing)